MNSRVLEVPSMGRCVSSLPLSKMQITWSLLRVMNHARRPRYASRIRELTGEEFRKDYLETCPAAPSRLSSANDAAVSCLLLERSYPSQHLGQGALYSGGPRKYEYSMIAGLNRATVCIAAAAFALALHAQTRWLQKKSCHDCRSRAPRRNKRRDADDRGGRAGGAI